MPEASVNFWAILAAAAFNMGFGYFWYSSAWMGPAWSKLTGIARNGEGSEGVSVEEMRQSVAASVFLSLVKAFALSWVVRAVHAENWLHGLLTGLVIGFGIVATTSAPGTIFGKAPRKLILINLGYTVTATILMSVLLAIWS